jgi:ribosome maturation factor RimP
MTAPLSHTTERLLALAAPLVASLGLEIWGLEFIPGGRSVVRLYIEGPGGVTVDKCAEVSRLVGLSLDVEDAVAGAYVLEVSSPGLERVFFTAAQLAPYAGSEDCFELALAAPGPEYPGRRNFTGKLVSAVGNVFTFLPQDPGLSGNAKDPAAPLAFTWDEVKKIRRIHCAPAPEKPRRGKNAARSPAAKNKKPPRAAAAEDAPSTGSGGPE